jgi:hypothetical protein
MAKGKFMMLIDRWRIGRFLSQLVNIVAASGQSKEHIEKTSWSYFPIHYGFF